MATDSALVSPQNLVWTSPLVPAYRRFMSAYAMDRASERVAELATRGDDVVSFFRAAGEAVTTAVPTVAPPCWCTLDPATLLITSVYKDDEDSIPTWALEWEYLGDDVMRTADAARSSQGFQTLSQATMGHPADSVVYREHLHPMGVEHAVEVVLRTRSGECWGSISLMRGAEHPDFDGVELDFLVRVAPLLAEGVRRGVLVGEACDPDRLDAPGLLVVDEQLELVSSTPGVERWLAELPGSWERDGTLPTCVRAVAARALRTAEGGDAPGEVAFARVLSAAGRWILLHGAAMVTDGRRRGAVIVEAAHPARLAPLLMTAYGLTRREREVTRAVLRGDTTTEIAAALQVSGHTVQQHLKNIFEKVGVRSRRELTARIFFAHYEPRIRDNERRTSNGGPARGGPVHPSL
jgi:DNA-binding CsgD family transcriptional regulator